MVRARVRPDDHDLPEPSNGTVRDFSMDNSSSSKHAGDSAYIIPNLDRALRIMEHLSTLQEGGTITEIATQLALPRTAFSESCGRWRPAGTSTSTASPGVSARRFSPSAIPPCKTPTSSPPVWTGCARCATRSTKPFSWAHCRKEKSSSSRSSPRSSSSSLPWR